MRLSKVNNKIIKHLLLTFTLLNILSPALAQRKINKNTLIRITTRKSATTRLMTVRKNKITFRTRGSRNGRGYKEEYLPPLKNFIPMEISYKKTTREVKPIVIIGTMQYKSNKHKQYSCVVAGRNIPVDWCKFIAPVSVKTKCKLSYKKSGKVIDLTCY